eukprot:TRINITY_DN6571_c0_g1_i1.p1 TRINITY_DN6571_c0_g1~~TRINITY_DN6571_c0_g1_i1.p1  ORF type:complete len:192 (+),score=27.06 TRINITY_DN6571_c0_g1_i1:48-578(+)
MEILRVGVLTISDRCSRGEAEDKSGPAIQQYLKDNAAVFKFAKGVEFELFTIPDEQQLISDTLIDWSDNKQLPLILTTGGTGFAPRDVTPEATKAVLHKEAPGIQIAMIQSSLAITPHAMLSRPAAGVRNKTLIVNLPGSPKGATENLAAVIVALPHAISLMLDLPKANEQHQKPK